MIKPTVSYYKCQLRGIEFLKAKKYGILALEQGLGKSLLALSHPSLNLKDKVLIVCPAYLRDNWAHEIKLYTDYDLKDFTVVSYEGSVSQITRLLKGHFNYFIFDESQYLKNIKAKRTRAALKLVATHKPEALALLSGTPAKNGLEALWSQLELINIMRPLKNFPKSLNAFKEKFIQYEVVNYGSLQVFKEIGVKNKTELVELLRDAMIIEKVKDNLDLPEGRIIPITAKTKDLDRSLAQFFDEHKQELKKIDRDHISSFKRDVALSKVDISIKWITDFMETNPDKSLVVFSCHPDAAQKIKDHFRYNSYLVTGSTSTSDRTYAKDAFQSGIGKLLIATIGSFSTGVTLTRAHNMLFNDYPWDSDDLAQAQSRIHRIGQTMPCSYYFIVSGQLDQQLLMSIARKKRIKTEAGL